MKEESAQYWNNEKWFEYFKTNNENLRDIPWESDIQLSDIELKSIAKSIATFQLGEYAEGRSFKKFGELYVSKSGDSFYSKALDLFIKEEQRHSNDLGRFMDSHGIPRLQKEWTDSTFRCLRKLMALELKITILVSAEYIAKIYYKALLKATDSPVLQTICKQILCDEVYHIHFQSAMLSRLREGRSQLLCTCQNGVFRMFYFCLLILVWHEHRKVFKQAKFSFVYYIKSGLKEFNASIKQIKSKVNKQKTSLDLSQTWND